MIALLIKRRPAARMLGFISWAIFMVFGVLPTGPLLLHKLEAQYQAPAKMPRYVDGIIVLGGALDTQIGKTRGFPQAHATVDRLTTFASLSYNYRRAKMVFTSGVGALSGKGVSEGDMVKEYLNDIGFTRPARLKIEGTSRTTYENVIHSKEMIQPKSGETWLMVTSAWHVPRAMGVFNARDWNVIPIPTDYRTAQPMKVGTGTSGFLGNMNASQIAMKEIFGIIGYRLTGKWKPQ